MVKPYHIHISSQHTMMSLILMVVKIYKIHMIVFRVLDISLSLRYILLRWIYTPDATAMRQATQLLRWRSDTIAKSLLFCCVAAIVFSSCCLVILIIFFYDFRWQLFSDGSDIARKLK